MAWGWYIPLGLLALALLVLLSRAKVGCAYEDDLRVWVGLGPIRLTLLPAKKQPEKKDQPAPPKEPQKTKKHKPAAPAPKLTLDEILDYIRLGLRSMGYTARCLRIDELTLHAVVGTPDAAETAVAYGAASAGLSALYPALASRIKVRKHDLSLDVSFTGESDVTLRLQLSGMFLCLAVAGLRVLFGFLKLHKQHEGKAVKQ